MNRKQKPINCFDYVTLFTKQKPIEQEQNHFRHIACVLNHACSWSCLPVANEMCFIGMSTAHFHVISGKVFIRSVCNCELVRADQSIWIALAVDALFFNIAVSYTENWLNRWNLWSSRYLSSSGEHTTSIHGWLLVYSSVCLCVCSYLMHDKQTQTHPYWQRQTFYSNTKIFVVVRSQSFGHNEKSIWLWVNRLVYTLVASGSAVLWSFSKVRSSS